MSFILVCLKDGVIAMNSIRCVCVGPLEFLPLVDIPVKWASLELENVPL